MADLNYCSGVARRRKVGGGGTNFFSQKVKSKKKKKKKGHSGVKAQDRGIVAYNLKDFLLNYWVMFNLY